MLGWLRKMFDRSPTPPVPPAPSLPPAPDPRHEDLDSAKAEHRRILGRADTAIRDAMAHADKVFDAPSYQGPDRRSKAR